ncbi:MAG: DNA topoisomerase IB [Bacteroidia bacterium]
MAELIYTSDSQPGYHRKGRGKGFEYFHENGKKLRDSSTLERIRNLVIPPMWKDVWICGNPNGHLQATGIDARGRKQSLYHEHWSASQNEHKFTRMAEFALTLPKLRESVNKDLRKVGWPRQKVLALLVTILDRCHIRIGNPGSMIENQTYGLTTLRRKHLGVKGLEISFDFLAKGGKEQHVSLKGKKVARLIRECSELPGYEVFQYLDEEGKRRAVHSQDVNKYLQKTTNTRITAKDFRTWGATVSAVEYYEEALAEWQKYPQRKLGNCLVKKVAQQLNNTLAVCRTYYIHPSVLEILSQPDADMQGLRLKASNELSSLNQYLNINERVALYLMKTHS